MGSLVDEQVEFAIRSIEEGNLELSNLVVERDVKVDKYDLKIDKICMKLFALNQPVAMDLRLIMSALTINTNLERMGDLAVNIAQNAEGLKEKPPFYKELPFSRIYGVAREMVRLAIDSFIESSAQMAQKVIQTDDVLDTLVRDNSRALVEVMKQNSSCIEPAVKLYTILHELERLGDHATNIAENVYFIVEAQMIKHRYEGILSRVDIEDEDDDKHLDE